MAGPQAMVETIKAGEADQKIYVQAIEGCWTKAQQQQDRVKALATSESCAAKTSWPKLKECEEASFLPY